MMNFSDLKPGMFLSTQDYGDNFGHICMVDSVNPKTGKIKVLEARNPLEGVIRSTFSMIDIELAHVVIPPKLDLIASKMRKVASDYVSSGRHYTSNLNEASRGAELLDEFYEINGVRYPLYKNRQEDITKPQVKKQFQCSSFCSRVYNKVAKHEKELNLPHLRRTNNLQEAGFIFKRDLPDGFVTDVILSPFVCKTPDTYFPRGSLKISRHTAAQIVYMKNKHNEVEERFLKAEEAYANKSSFYRTFRGGDDYQKIDNLRQEKRAVASQCQLVYDSLDEKSKGKMQNFFHLDEELKLRDKFNNAIFNSDGSTRANYTYKQALEAKHLALREALGDDHPKYTQKIDKSLQLTKGAIGLMEIISEINITDEKIAPEVNEFLNENCKAMNKALWKHADTTKILFENNRRYDKKIAEIKQISSYIESNKDKHENLTKTKFNEWKAANEKQEKTSVEEKPNRIEQTIVKQETTHNINPPVLSNSQALNVSQPIV